MWLLIRVGACPSFANILCYMEIIYLCAYKLNLGHLFIIMDVLLKSTPSELSALITSVALVLPSS